MLFGLLTWLAKDKIEQHTAISALGILVICFLANASVLLPSSSVLVVVEYSRFITPFLVAFCGAFGSAFGEMTGFYIGRHGIKVVPSKLVKWVNARMVRHKYLMVFLFSVMPLPGFDIIGILSGAMKMNAL